MIAFEEYTPGFSDEVVFVESYSTRDGAIAAATEMEDRYGAQGYKRYIYPCKDRFELAIIKIHERGVE